MYASERTARILEILRQYNYVTVKHLTAALNYSTATVNRDLNLLEKQGLIKRFYGGVQLAKSDYIPMDMRYYKMKHEKRLIAQEAAKHVKDGDRVFIDCTTTTHYMGEYIKDRRNLTVITNSIALVSDLSVHGVNVICLGGKVVEPPYSLGSVETVGNAADYRANKMFFSTGAFDETGTVGTSESYAELLKMMMRNSEKIYYLADRDKLGKYTPKVLCEASKIHCFFSDYEFDAHVQRTFPQTKFIKVDVKKASV